MHTPTSIVNYLASPHFTLGNFFFFLCSEKTSEHDHKSNQLVTVFKQGTPFGDLEFCYKKLEVGDVSC